MKKYTLALLCCLTAPLAQAQMLQPGLWELTTSNMNLGGQALPDMQLMLNSLPPEQRAMIQRQLGTQGVAVAGKGVQVCLTPEQVKGDDIPLTDPKSGCTQRITERNGNNWKFTFTCPKAQGSGQAQFLSQREFTTHVVGTLNAGGQPQNGSMDTRAVWQSPQCGAVKPRT